MNSMRFSEMEFNEQVMLLAFLPLLGATAHMSIAVVVAVAGVITTLVVRLVARTVVDRFGESARWTILIATGLTIPYLLTVGVQFVIPLPSVGVMYVYLVGVTPMIYLGVGTEDATPGITPVLVRYTILVIVFGLVREVFGNGSLFGYAIPWLDGQAPVGIVATNAGALLVFAIAAFLGHVVPKVLNQRNSSVAQRGEA